MNDDKYYKLYDELVKVANEILPYYDIDKIKPYSVYIWTKYEEVGEDNDTNVFDIMEDEIRFYDKQHIIKDEAKPIIEKIQMKLKEINCCCK